MNVDYQALLETYRLRLINLSQGNRTLKLLKCYDRQDVDFTDLAYTGTRKPSELFSQFLSGKVCRLLNEANLTEERLVRVDRQLTLLYRELRQREEETGAYDLAIGYPFVEGRFAEGTPVRSPLVLFPAELIRNRKGNARWQLQLRERTDVQLNPTLFRAYEKYNDLRLPESFWEDSLLPSFPGLQPLLNHLFELFQRYGLGIRFPSDLFLQHISPLRSLSDIDLQRKPASELKLADHAVLGLFPQSDTALLQDYNNLVDSWPEFPLAEVLEGRPTLPADYHCKEQFRWFPLPVDGSQEEVLLHLKAGADMAVDGPPGTGKSQLIVNAVADALAEGKQVLVVSVKRAALDVVAKRLAGLGLASWTYLLHDHLADRTTVFQQLAEQLHQRTAPNLLFSHEHSLAQWQAHCTRIDSLISAFEAYLSALQTKLPCGQTPEQLYSYLLAQPGPLITDTAIQTLGDQFTAASLEDTLHLLRAIAHYPDLLDEGHPWFDRISFCGWDEAAHKAFTDKLAKLPEQLKRLTLLLEPLRLNEGNALLHPDLDIWLVTLADWIDNLESDKRLADNAFLCWEADFEVSLQLLESLSGLCAQVATCSILLAAGQAEVDEAAALLDTYITAQKKPLHYVRPIYYRAKQALDNWLCAHGLALSAASIQLLEAELAKLRQWKQAVAVLPGHADLQDAPPALPVAEWEDWIKEKRAAIALVAQIRQHPLFALLSPISDSGVLEMLKSMAVRIHDARIAYEEQIGDWQTWLPTAKVDVLVQYGRTATEGAREIQRWQVAYQQDRRPLQELDNLLARLDGPGNALLPYLRPQLRQPEEEWFETTTLQFSQVWLEQAERDYPSLRYPTTRTFASDSRELGERLEAKRNLLPELLAARLAETVASAEGEDEGSRKLFAELSYQVNKQRRLWPLRRLVATYWEKGLAAWMPIVLASPETVAAVFPLAANLFDLVVIDEASQCRVEAALPVLLRGRQRLVAGDDRQLPPFNLFRVQTEAGYDDDHLATDAESILALTRSSFQPGMLQWHYRSEDPALIAFSNMHFYRNRLRYLPPAQKVASAFHYRHVPGVWEKQRNQVEAAYVVDALEQVLGDYPEASVGVVTFSYRQQEAVLDALDERLTQLVLAGDTGRLPLLQGAYERRRGTDLEPLFVRNLENVQGDERDIILFSTGYARDIEGKLRLQFGLLNQVGGENRLNVAITRARKAVWVISSLLPHELEADDLRYPGPRLLKAYLAYVQASVSHPATSSPVGQPLPAWLDASLTQQGWCNMESPPHAAEDLRIVAWREGNRAVQLCRSVAPKDVRSWFVYQNQLFQSKGWQRLLLHLPSLYVGSRA